MSTLGISLSDSGIVACLFDGEDTALFPLERESVQSPGFAYLGDRGLILGEAAMAHFRLNPDRTTDRFWDQLSLQTSALRVTRKPISNAHLAYLHLKHLWERVTAANDEITSVGLALPGPWLDPDPEQEEKLGILLGIISDLNIPLSVLLPQETANLHYDAPDEVAAAPVSFYLDLHQYHAQLYRLSGRSGVEPRVAARLPSCGFHHILNDLHQKLTQLFLSETAFDIGEDSEVEQEFFLKVRRLLAPQHNRATRELAVQYEGHSRKITVAEDTLERSLYDWTERLAAMVATAARAEPEIGPNQPLVLQVSGRAESIPGLGRQIQRAVMRPVLLLSTERGASAAGAATVANRFEPVRDLQHTPIFNTWQRPEPAAGATAAGGPDASAYPPTHVLADAIAYPLHASGLLENGTDSGSLRLPGPIREAFRLPWAGSDLSVTPAEGLNLTVNQRAAEGSLTLKTGDSLSVRTEGEQFELQIIHCPPPD